MRLSLALFVIVAACGREQPSTPQPSNPSAPTQGKDYTPDDKAADDTPDDKTPVDKAAKCASTFGDALTDAFGRLDGTVVAVVKPTDTACAMPNNDHVVLQVKAKGAVYRMVINVQSSGADADVRYLAFDHASFLPDFSEGWHTGLAFDYAADLGVHTSDFVAHPMAELSDLIADAIKLGQKVSVYAVSSGGASAHEIHRNDGATDGAIVLNPDASTSRMLLFHFSNQTF